MSEEHPHEIFIVKHSHDDHEDGHHGGAWKIAFADFMTAMMALFLVLWLMGANAKTKESLAHFFNPIKLQEMTKKQQGLSEPDDSAPSFAKVETGKDVGVKDTPNKEKAAGGESGEPAPKYTETELFHDPFTILDKIAGQVARADDAAKPSPKADKPTESAKESQAFSDPFAPSSPPNSSDPHPTTAAVVQAPRPPETKTPEIKPADSQMVAAIQKMFEGEGSSLQVTNTPEGTLISVTEATNFPMFASSSAEPQPKLVQLLSKVGNLIKTANRPIIVRGFTDSRNFKTKDYDNWRLSADRANMARLMLLRGGVPEKLFDRVEGHSDRQLKNPAHPEMAENRRIEILIQGQK
jgi:chemotaxis protein MotB